MERRLLRRPSAALVVATGALVVSLAGTGYALSIPANSVGAKQLKTNAVTSAKIKNGEVKFADLASNSVTSAKIVDGSITAGDVAPGAFVAGPGSIFTFDSDVSSGPDATLGTLNGFGEVKFGCAVGGGGEDELAVNDGQAGTLTLFVQYSDGTIVSATAASGADATVSLASLTQTTYRVRVSTGSSVATGTLWRTPLMADCHVSLQGIANA